MKTISFRKLQKKIKECINDSQGERAVITRSGKRAAILFGVEGSDWETVVLQMDPEFWKLIEKRRKEPVISFEEFEKRLEKSS